MSVERQFVHPYIPNSEPRVKREMLDAVDAESVDEFFEDVPEALRFRGQMDLPDPLLSEYALRRHVETILAKNETARERLSFLGAGCYPHHVPAVCDEVNQRGEFLTAYAGEPYDDHGRFQALFEYVSMMGELLNMDVVNVPTYDGFQAVATSLRMACRLTGRREVLVAGTVSADLLSKVRDYCQPNIDVRLVDYDPATGQMNIDNAGRPQRRAQGLSLRSSLHALETLISDRTAAVFFENPSYLGFVETQGARIAEMAHEHGALCVVGADPISLGVLKPPADYGADIVCGDIQSLGMHMQFGGGNAGYIATRDEAAYVMEYPSRLFGIAPTCVPGEYGFGDVAYERTSFAIREEGNEWVGTAAALWGITAGVYLALMGPQGMREIGESIIARSRYAALALDALPGVKAPLFAAPYFREFVVNFDDTGQTVVEINERLRARGIFGGKDLSGEFPELGQSALYCVTEIHTQADIDRLAHNIADVIQASGEVVA